MLRPLPFEGFCRGFLKNELKVLFQMSITLVRAEGDFHRSVGGNEGSDRVKSIGGSTSSVNLIGHSSNVKDSLCSVVFRGAAAYYDGGCQRDAVLTNAKCLSPGCLEHPLAGVLPTTIRRPQYDRNFDYFTGLSR